MSFLRLCGRAINCTKQRNISICKRYFALETSAFCDSGLNLKPLVWGAQGARLNSSILKTPEAIYVKNISRNKSCPLYSTLVKSDINAPKNVQKSIQAGLKVVPTSVGVQPGKSKISRKGHIFKTIQELGSIFKKRDSDSPSEPTQSKPPSSAKAMVGNSPSVNPMSESNTNVSLVAATSSLQEAQTVESCSSAPLSAPPTASASPCAAPDTLPSSTSPIPTVERERGPDGRFWFGPEVDGSASKHSSQIRVVSYNILADVFVNETHRNYCDEAYLSWDFRRRRIEAELDESKADVICLQEVDHAYIQGGLSLWCARRGFSMKHLVKRVARGKVEGLVVLWRNQVFKKVAERDQVFARMTPTDLQLPMGMMHTPAWRIIRNRPDGAVLVILRHVPSGRYLLVSSTHLFYSPRHPDVKALQAALLCSAAAALLRSKNLSPSLTPVILAGDFNSFCHQYRTTHYDYVRQGETSMVSGVYELLCTGKLRPGHPHHPATVERVGACVKLLESRVPEPEGKSDESPSKEPQTQATSKTHQSIFPSTAASGASPGAPISPSPSSPSSDAPSSGSPMPSGDSDDDDDGGGTYVNLFRRAVALVNEGQDVEAPPGSAPLTAAEEVPTNAWSSVVLTTGELSLKSVYSEVTGSEPPMTNKNENFAGCLDYIWVSHPTCKALRVLSMPYQTPRSDKPVWILEDPRGPNGPRGVVETEGPVVNPLSVATPPIPSAQFPSDHLRIAGDIEVQSFKSSVSKL